MLFIFFILYLLPSSKEKRDFLTQSPNKSSKKNSNFIDFNEKKWQMFLSETSILNSNDINLENFKYSCINEKGVLFENDFLQIGSITSKMQNRILGNLLYFGNKTKSEIIIEDLNVLNHSYKNSKKIISILFFSS